MDLRNCPQCGRVFVYLHSNLCPACKKNEEEEFVKVKNHLKKNPHISIFELSEATEVDESKIVKWVREGRLEGENHTGLTVSCERCGKMMPKGRYCQQCSNELAKGFSGPLSSKERKEELVNKPKVKFHIKE
ncbi:MAG: TIGR03826 family flagellar region protein [Peptococcaceae bacterium]